MWVILKEPLKNIDFEALAIHLETFNAIVILNLDNKFQLAILKYFDGHQSNQSNMHCLLASFDTYKRTQDFFQEIVDSLKTGDPIFDLRSHTDSGEKKSKGGYL